MANQYYSIRVDSAANTLADFKAALLDYYGAYNDPANLTGVRFDYDSSPYLIFRCSAIADQYIRIYMSATHALFSYGDGVAGNNVTNPVAFGGTSSTGTLSEAHLVLGPQTLLWQTLQSTTNSRIVLLGQLSNNDYAVLACMGNSYASYNSGCAGRNTTDSTDLWPVTLSHGFQSAAGKLYTQSIILKNGVVGMELTGAGAIASFQDIYNVSYSQGNTTVNAGSTFILTTSGMYMNNALAVFPTSLLMQYEPIA
jgi:hypothetical protein